MCLIIKELTNVETARIRELKRKKKKFMHLINEKAKIAEEDIKVYKILDYYEIGGIQKMMSPYFLQCYIFEKEYKAKFKFGFIISFGGRYDTVVNDGLHSYSLQRNVSHFQRNSVFDATVPKGARYFEGVYGDIVSERLIVHETK